MGLMELVVVNFSTCFVGICLALFVYADLCLRMVFAVTGDGL